MESLSLPGEEQGEEEEEQEKEKEDEDRKKGKKRGRKKHGDNTPKRYWRRKIFRKTRDAGQICTVLAWSPSAS